MNLRIIKSSLEPLSSVGIGGVLVKVGEMTTETSDSLTSHGVSLVGHGGGSNLVLLEGLLHLLGGSKMTDITSDALDCGTQTGESVGDSEINLAGVCLSANIITLWETGLLAEEFVQFVNLSTIAVEDLHEGG